jgi:hypothetical protein
MTDADPVLERPAGKQPFYPRLLRLKNIHPNAPVRALLGEGMAALGFLASPGGADIAPFWAIVVLPVAMAGVVKAHDLLAGALRPVPPEALRSE